MIIIKNVQTQISRIIDYLQAGKVICFPTETVYALACDATNPNAINKLYDIKARNKKKQFSILIYDLKTLKKYAIVNKYAISLIEKFSPGAMTYVLPNKNLPNWPEYLGIRIPKHPIARLILKNYPQPLVGTSVNLSGQASARTFEEIPEIMKSSIDMIVADDSKTYVSGLPSTVIDLSAKDKYTILRKGEISEANIVNISANGGKNSLG